MLRSINIRNYYFTFIVAFIQPWILYWSNPKSNKCNDINNYSKKNEKYGSQKEILHHTILILNHVQGNKLFEVVSRNK